MKKINTHSKFQSSIPCLPLTREVARRSRDGGRENQIKTAILTTPQSSSMTAPLTRGAKNIDFRPIKIINTLVSIILIILMLCSCGKTKESDGVSSVTSGETVKTDISTDNMDFELTNNDLKTNISQIIIAYYWALIKFSKSPANKGFFANNLFQFVMTYYFVFPLPESIIRAKLRERIIKILSFSLGKRTVAM